VIAPRFGVRLAFLAVVGLGAAVPASRRQAPQGAQPPSHRPVRVLLGATTTSASVETHRGWRLLDAREGVVWPDGGEGSVAVERQRDRLRVRHAGTVTPWYDGAVTIEAATPDELLAWGGRSYRGSLTLVPTDTAILVVNRLDVEDYLRGVVPLEVGRVTPDEHAAVEAQAVAARSYTYTRMLAAGQRAWDLTTLDSDQVYGGAAVETFLGDLAVSATAGWVLSVGGEVVIAPYHAICGGHTASPSEVWRGGSDAFLRGVSDEGPEPGRSWCDVAPRFAWERRLSVEALASAIARHGVAYEGSVRGVREARGLILGDSTATGRVGTLVVDTDRGALTLRGNDIRFVLRPDGVEVLPSTRFRVTEERGADGRLRAWLLAGRGHGHGVGMCQWGAIGRARAGHDFRVILRAYYPGAELTRAP
jgi:stage II sporulation protein D